jgi:phosphoribosylglycinamide formyltransferase-1
MPDALPDARKFRISILLSGRHGRGSNLAALFAATSSGAIPRAEIVQVIGTHAESPALQRAKDLGLTVDLVDLESPEFDNELIACIARRQPDVICLAGYMRKVPGQVVEKFRHRILNIHPGLLPAFAGKGMYGSHVHQAVLNYGAKVTGCTVHLIDEDYDTGPIILQKTVPVLEGDDIQSLGARVLAAEHESYVEALKLIAEGRVSVEGRIVHIAGR